ncbi:MAG: hypothetical protein ACE5I1_25970, partial [bacterium]
MMKSMITVLHILAVLVVLPTVLFAQTTPTLDWEWDPHPRWLTGVNWGGATFYGGLDYGKNFFGST